MGRHVGQHFQDGPGGGRSIPPVHGAIMPGTPAPNERRPGAGGLGTLGAMETLQLLIAERRRLADTLDALTAKEWHTQLRCSAWTIPQVAAHLNVGPTVSLAHLSSP